MTTSKYTIRIDGISTTLEALVERESEGDWYVSAVLLHGTDIYPVLDWHSVNQTEKEVAKAIAREKADAAQSHAEDLYEARLCARSYLD